MKREAVEYRIQGRLVAAIHVLMKVLWKNETTVIFPTRIWIEHYAYTEFSSGIIVWRSIIGYYKEVERGRMKSNEKEWRGMETNEAERGRNEGGMKRNKEERGRNEGGMRRKNSPPIPPRSSSFLFIPPSSSSFLLLPPSEGLIKELA